MLAAAGGPPLEQLPLEEARRVPRLMQDFGGPEEAVAQVDTRVIGGAAQQIPVRVYRPSAAQDLPCLVFMHGGGFVICDLDSHDRLCRNLANAVGSVVVSVDYRLAPEHKFPAAADDAYGATRYVAEHPSEFGIDPNRIAVGGDSAGGNLAAVVSLMARDRGGPSIKFQLMFYPWVDVGDRSESMRQFSENYFLTRGSMDWFRESYVKGVDDYREPYAFPMRAPDLSRLPPAMVITAEFDPLRDQGEAYARRLQEAGVPVQLKRYDGMIHVFVTLAGIVDDGRAAIADAASALRLALNAEAPARV